MIELAYFNSISTLLWLVPFILIVAPVMIDEMTVTVLKAKTTTTTTSRLVRRSQGIRTEVSSFLSSYSLSDEMTPMTATTWYCLCFI